MVDLWRADPEVQKQKRAEVSFGALEDENDRTGSALGFGSGFGLRSGLRGSGV